MRGVVGRVGALRTHCRKWLEFMGDGVGATRRGPSVAVADMLALRGADDGSGDGRDAEPLDDEAQGQGIAVDSVGGQAYPETETAAAMRQREQAGFRKTVQSWVRSGTVGVASYTDALIMGTLHAPLMHAALSRCGEKYERKQRVAAARFISRSQTDEARPSVALDSALPRS